MSPLLLSTFNQYVGSRLSASQAGQFVASLKVFPVPDRMAMDDWRAHVPMHLLESWRSLPVDERLALFVMAVSATHPYEFVLGPEEPIMN